MQAVVVVIILALAGIGWLISAVQESSAKAGRRAEAKSRMRALGLDEKDLPTLLAKVPRGYLERSLYWAKRRAEDAAASMGNVSRAEAVVELHSALERHEQEQQRAALRAAEQQRRVAELMTLAANCGPPERPQLIIGDGDFSRENESDRSFRRLYLLRLLALYDNACAICGSRSNGLDLDHFFIPKSQGGNFVLVRGDGLKINNAVPMCESCNRAKGDKDWREVASHEQLTIILNRNADANKLVNDSSGASSFGTRKRR